MPSSPYSDLSRPPLHQPALRRALLTPGGLWTEIRVVTETGSTNADVAAAARAGAPEGLVLVAERQSAGRGRMDRQWTSPARAGIAVSVLLRPGTAVPTQGYGWLPLLAGVALAEGVRRVAEVDAVVKWPNDLLVRAEGELRKCAGILAEVVPAPGGSADPGGPAVVVGIGLNTSVRAHELPRPDATSLALAGAVCADRDPVLRAVLRALAVWYGRWRAAAGDAQACGLTEAYTFHSDTIGRTVRVALPGGAELVGTAHGVDGEGRLVVAGVDGTRRPVAAGDVVHLR
ncbi:MAG TPA: biotin--[acetyl-CoA-carboxylase] ligase [Micromonosporaceae bacterium]|nr:biotin--[acetyl-CoA-carboxylase] ligase [Micromonosporaceae bacterium]